jgi:PAS domain S-box-containing protein
MIERQAPLWGGDFAWEIVEALSLGVAILGDGLQFEYVNPAYARMIGRSPEELVGVSPFNNTLSEGSASGRLEIIHPDDLPGIVDRLTGLQTTGSSDALDLEYRMRQADGSWRWVHNHNTAFKRGADGRVQQIIASITDVTKRMHTEAALRQSEANLSAVFNNTLQAFILFDRDRRVLARNSIADNWVRQMLGRPLEIGAGPDELFGQFKPETFHESFNRALQGETITRQLEIATPGGEFWFEISHNPVVSESEGVVGVSMSVLNIAERKKAEKAFRESEEKLRLFIKHAPAALAMFDRDMHYLAFSHRWMTDYGLKDREIIGRSHYDLFPEIPERWKEAHRRGLDGEVMQKDEDDFERLDGTVQWLRWEMRPWYTADGVVGGIVIFTEDITERKQAEAALVINEQRFRALIEHAPDAIIILSFSGRIKYASPATGRILGFSRDEILEGDPVQFTHPDDLPGLLVTLNELIQAPGTTATTQYRMRHKDGSYRWLESNISNIYDIPGIKGLVFNFRDVTESRAAEEKLRQNESQLQHIINTVPEGVMLLDGNGAVRLTNPVAKQYLAILQPDQENGRLTRLGNKPLPELFTPSPDDLWHDIIVDEYAFEAIARPVENGSNYSGWVLVLHDVTHERNIQQRIQQQDRLAAVGQLAAGIAHDFNNIMGVIILYAELILRKEALSPLAQERLYTIEKQAQRATELIQQILDFSRQSVLERQLLDLLPFMKELVKLFDRTLPEHIQIELNHIGEEFIIHADLSRIQQVMMNLAVNARDAMPDGGRLRISLAQLQTEQPGPLPIRDMPPGQWIQIQITDSGTGIPAEVLPKIFEPFFTTKGVGRGTGLGLAQVYGIVQQHKGHIDVQTKLGEGTTFLLYFPAIVEPSGKGAAMLNEVSLQQGQGQTVLIVEDDPATRKALESSLSFLNYKIVEATNGREALAILETEAEPIALVLSDVVMPEMGGIALLHAMRKRRLTTPVVLLTGHPLSEDMENLREFGLAGWLPKPPNLVNLGHMITQVLTEPDKVPGTSLFVEHPDN